MKKHVFFFIKIFVLILAALLVIRFLNNIFIVKNFCDSPYPTTSTYRGFYGMDTDTVDVIALGSSHSVNAIIPQLIYDEKNIRMYNLSCEQQSILASYWWLREALNYQHPSVIVLDTYLLFPLFDADSINEEEPMLRKAIDNMRWGKVKLEAVRAICDTDEEQQIESYFFPMIRYHSRWNDLTKNDFYQSEFDHGERLKGYSVNDGCFDRPFTQGMNLYNQTPNDFFHPVMKEYLDKIVALCRKENIELILIKTPNYEWTAKKHDIVSRYAAENSIEFYDFNTGELYNEIGFDFSADMGDSEHANLYGAMKISSFLANELSERFCVPSVKDSQWEDSTEYFRQIIEKAQR